MDVDVSVFMPLITDSAQAKNYAFEALTCAKSKDEEGYKRKLKEAQSCLIQAHQKQTDLLTLNAREEETTVTIYLVHAMDHVSNAQMVYDLVQELADIHLNKTGI
ncbi:PTS lactose/cellobiose transporter subunit IIA [Halobacillus litoralis]|uniref:PTS lactose/cellobiose transporter subunit IIA n=1 Tax=Halobacillus litoralis TaxID=45668 RepID=UPI001CD3FCC1|nr:PTS lactose/cellobiose transporter subunit IIA [Halobacillus litoralis]MCA1021981.1 PTS lactose/cellobiose transporter subunit IIA [Halobacillus litoralis]